MKKLNIFLKKPANDTDSYSSIVSNNDEESVNRFLQQRKFENPRPDFIQRIVQSAVHSGYYKPDIAQLSWGQTIGHCVADILPKPAYAFGLMLMLGLTFGYYQPLLHKTIAQSGYAIQSSPSSLLQNIIYYDAWRMP